MLEDAVDDADENDLELVGLNAITTPPTAADKAAVATAFQNAFADPVNDGKEQIKLGADFSLSQVSPSDPDRWVVHGDDVTYLLQEKGALTQLFRGNSAQYKGQRGRVAGVSRNTSIQKLTGNCEQPSIRWHCRSIYFRGRRKAIGTTCKVLRFAV